MKKILLINANFVHNHSLLTRFMIKTIVNPSLVLPYVAASIPTDKYDIKTINDSYKNINYEEDCDLVGISTATPSAPRAYEIADEFRKRGKKVVLGGIHPTVLPNEALKHADAVVVGEAEKNFPKLLNDYEKNQLKKIYYSKEKICPENIPLPDRRVEEIYPLIAGVQTSRGCPYNCKFCTLARVNGANYRAIPIKKVIEDIKTIPRKFLIMIHDSSLTISTEYVKKLFKEMMPLKKKFMCYGSIPVLIENEEIIELSKKAGCIYWALGFETITQKSLNDAGKNYKVEQYEYIVKKIKQNGMGIFGSFVFGFDHDTPDVFETTLQKVQSWGIDAAEFNILIPFPGTEIYHTFEKQGRILHKDWSKYDLQHIVFQPKNMTPEELYNGVRSISKRFYSVDNVLKREASAGVFNLSKFLYTIALNSGMRLFHQSGYGFRDKASLVQLFDSNILTNLRKRIHLGRG